MPAVATRAPPAALTDLDIILIMLVIVLIAMLAVLVRFLP